MIVRSNCLVQILFHFCHVLKCTGKFTGSFYRIMSQWETAGRRSLILVHFSVWGTATVMPTAVCWTWTRVKWIRMKNTELSSAESTAGLIFSVRLTPNNRQVGTMPAERNRVKTYLYLTNASPAEAFRPTSTQGNGLWHSRSLIYCFYEMAQTGKKVYDTLVHLNPFACQRLLSGQFQISRSIK